MDTAILSVFRTNVGSRRIRRGAAREIGRLLLVLLLCSVAAQAALRSVRGVVLGGDGKPVEGAVVMLKSTDKPAIRSFHTSANGEYRFVGLNPLLDYTVRARTREGSSRRVYLSHVSSRNHRVVNLRIRTGRQVTNAPHQGAQPPAAEPAQAADNQ
jgi:hypothetical protein